MPFPRPKRRVNHDAPRKAFHRAEITHEMEYKTGVNDALAGRPMRNPFGNAMGEALYIKGYKSVAKPWKNKR